MLIQLRSENYCPANIRRVLVLSNGDEKMNNQYLQLSILNSKYLPVNSRIKCLN